MKDEVLESSKHALIVWQSSFHLRTDPLQKVMSSSYNLVNLLPNVFPMGHPEDSFCQEFDSKVNPVVDHGIAVDIK